MREYVYLGRDNTIERQLLADGTALTALQMQAITRMDLVYNGQTINSDDNPEAFDWSTRESEGVVIFALSGLSISTGTDLAADLYVYDAEHVNGIRWGSFSLSVEQG